MATRPKTSSPKKSKNTSKTRRYKKLPLTVPEVRKTPKRLARRQSLANISEDAMNHALADFHADVFGDLAYYHLSAKLDLGPELLEMAVRAGVSFQQQMRPKDALERLALTQALLAHARAAWLTKLLTSQTDPPCFGTIAEAAERAAGTFARLMRAFAEYRRPPNSSATVSIGQANLAHQQVVQNIQRQEGPQEKHGEQTRIREDPATINTAVVPAVEEGFEVIAGRNPADPTVDEKHRPQNAGRKGPSRDERSETRRALSRRRQTAQAGKTND